MKTSHSIRRFRRPGFCVLLAVLLLLPVCFLAACGTDTEKKMVALKILSLPDRTSYTAGETFDRSGLTVAVVFSDGTEAQITAYNVHPQILTEGTDRVFVSYKEGSVAIPVTVSPAGSGDESRTIDVSLPDRPDSSADTSKAEHSDPASEPDPVSEDSDPQPDERSETEPDEIIETLTEPVKTVYVAGERFDATGLMLQYTGAYTYSVPPDAVPDQPLQAGQTSVDVQFGGSFYPVPVTVVDGIPASFRSSYTDADAKQKYGDFSAQVQSMQNRTGDAFDVYMKLPNPHPDGYVSNIDELTAYLDYHLFYGIESVIVHAYCSESAFEKELDSYYYRSKLCASFAAVQQYPLGNGWFQVLFRLYPDNWIFCPGEEVLRSEFISVPFFTPAKQRSSSYKFAKLDDEKGITVYHSEQLVYALANGYSVAPVPGSPAEAVVNKAKTILRSLNGDDLTDFQKIYNISLWFVRNVQYDFTGEVLASHVCDFEMEPDQFSSRFVSFHAEGPLLYGNSVCYGFAKANTVLLALEGIDVTRVVGKDSSTKGRSAYSFNTETGAYEEIFSIHSYNYVTLGGRQYLVDPTFAYAGNPQVDTSKVTWYRNFCIGLSKADHKQLYSSYEPDPVSSSPDYRPGSFVYQNEFTYPSSDGEKSATVRSRQDLEDYVAYLRSAAGASSSAYCSACILVAANAYNQDTLISDARALFESSFSRFVFAYGKREIGGENYFDVLVLFRN